MPRKRPRAVPQVTFLPRVDGVPTRSVTSLNLRKEEKVIFDHLHSWWSLRNGAPLKQVDAFSMLLSLALENPRADVPEELRP